MEEKHALLEHPTGCMLRMSTASETGYMHVSVGGRPGAKRKFVARIQRKKGEPDTHLGSFDTAEEAAIAVAKYCDHADDAPEPKRKRAREPAAEKHTRSVSPTHVCALLSCRFPLTHLVPILSRRQCAAVGIEPDDVFHFKGEQAILNYAALRHRGVDMETAYSMTRQMKDPMPRAPIAAHEPPGVITDPPHGVARSSPFGQLPNGFTGMPMAHAMHLPPHTNTSPAMPMARVTPVTPATPAAPAAHNAIDALIDAHIARAM